jgi:DNA-binding phage protein
VTRSGPAPAVARNRAQDAAATTPHNVTCQSSADDDREAHQRELKAFVQHGMDGDGYPLDRLRTAARRGRQLIAAGSQRVARSASLTAVAEAAGVARRAAQNISARR